MQRQRCAINAIVAEASPVKLLKRYTRLAQASKDIVRTDIPQQLLSAFVDLAEKVKGQPIKSVSFERSDDFDPNAPDFGYVHTAVQAALFPARVTLPSAASSPSAAAAVGTPGVTAQTPSGASTAAAAPARVSDASADCAYHPVGDAASG
jgi:hypothetical protein